MRLLPRAGQPSVALNKFPQCKRRDVAFIFVIYKHDTSIHKHHNEFITAETYGTLHASIVEDNVVYCSALAINVVLMFQYFF